MGTMSVDELIEKTDYTLFESITTTKAQRYSVGLAINWKVPGFHPVENIFHVHLELIKRDGSDQIYLVNNTPRQMICYKFWRWLEDSVTSDFMYHYLARMYNIIHAAETVSMPLN
jgi:hypothetical protein